MTLYARHRLRFYRKHCVPEKILSHAIRFHLVGAEQFPWESVTTPQFLAVYRERLAAGGQALLGRSDDTLVFTAWVQWHALRVDELALTWELQDSDAVVYDVVTVEAWRGRGIYPEGLRQLSVMLAERGMRSLWIYAETDNASSLRGIEKADFEFQGQISACTIAGTTIRRGKVKGVNA